MPERDSPGGFPENGRMSRLYIKSQFSDIKGKQTTGSSLNSVATLPLGQECQRTNSSLLYSRCQSIAVESINLVFSYLAKVLQDTEFHTTCKVILSTFLSIALDRSLPLRRKALPSWQNLVAFFGEGDGTPLQYSCLENPMDGGAWWAAVHGVTKSQT